jgi:PQQ-dependent dehydrogenase (s-GDH family)
VVASGLANPWEITWGPDGQLWVTERSGKRITRVNPETGERKTAITIDEVSAPGGQDGLLGLALHPDLLKGKGRDFVYVFYTYDDKAKGPDPNVKDPTSPFRFLYGKLVRLTYDARTASLGAPLVLLSGLPAGNDHVAGRLKMGPDGKLYLTLGDQGHNQLGNFCLPIESQRLPSAEEVRRQDWAAYVGKTLRINPDGSIPADNPRLNGVVSHVFTYGHRNTQGIDFAPSGVLYASEHGPKTDDEVNILIAGGNYGWPHVAGFKDNKAYEYARWAEASIPCSELTFSDLAIHPSVPREPESAYTKPFINPLVTMFTVPTGYNFENPVCGGIHYICWPTVAPSSIEYYESGPQGIPGWDKVLLVPTLKRGSLYVVPLDATGKKLGGPIARYFRSENRYRDTAVHPNRKTIFIATDARGLVEARGGGVARRMQDPGAILAFTYEGEGAEPEPQLTSSAGDGEPAPSPPPAAVAGPPPQFTLAQAAEGKKAYNTHCAVCHGSTLSNGTMGTPLAGPYFQKTWRGRTVAALLERSLKTMPPAAPGSLPRSLYADIVAYILQMNGYQPGSQPLPAEADQLQRMMLR